MRQGMAVRGHSDLEGDLLQLLKLRSEDCSQLNVWHGIHLLLPVVMEMLYLLQGSYQCAVSFGS